MDYPLHTLIGFLVYTGVASFTPGPNNILVMSCAGRFGLGACLPLLAGIGSGIAGVTALCGLCTLALAELLPSVTPVLTGAGALYILRLAWNVAFQGSAERDEEAEPPGFWTGFLLQFVNVKGILYGLTSFTAFVLPFAREPLSAAGFTLALAVIGFAGVVCWAAGGSLLRVFFRRHGRILNPMLGLLLAGCVVQLFI